MHKSIVDTPECNESAVTINLEERLDESKVMRNETKGKPNTETEQLLKQIQDGPNSKQYGQILQILEDKPATKQQYECQKSNSNSSNLSESCGSSCRSEERSLDSEQERADDMIELQQRLTRKQDKSKAKELSKLNRSFKTQKT